jgi:pimeloyl-ACP methyl ester carboxylesterase/AraC-like DNA-binding protein
VDVLGDILSSLHLTGGVVVDARCAGDWCMISQFTAQRCAQYFPVPGTLVAYHYVRSGELWAEVEGQPPVHAREGAILIFPRNDRHLLYNRPGVPPIDADDLLKPGENGGPATIRIEGKGAATEIFCGFLGVSEYKHPLIDCLPPVLLLDDDEATREWVASSMRFLADQSPEMVAQIAEAFVSHAIRTFLEDPTNDAEGWIGGLRDPAVARALAIIHQHYAEDLDIEHLAREAGVSRSVLGERFTTYIGEPPMRYCAGWRMRMAANMLRDSKESTAEIAHAVGFQSEAAFNRAFKREFGEPPATWRRRVAAEARAEELQLPEQTVLYTAAHDGTRLAYSSVGSGPPLVKTANWLNHLEFDFESPIWRGWIRQLACDFQLVRYDERGNGLSDWDTPELSLDAFVDDLACVVDAAGIERFDLLGISQGAAVAVAYSLKYPERVRRIVLLGGYAAGWRTRADNEEVARREAMMTLTELGWGRDNPAYRQLFTSFYIPGANLEQMSWFNELQRRSASPENAVKLMRVLSNIDVRHLLRHVRHPVLVLHARGDQAIPFEEGERLAAEMNARFVPLQSNNHILLENEPAFRTFVEELREFLGDSSPSQMGRGTMRSMVEG